MKTSEFPFWQIGIFLLEIASFMFSPLPPAFVDTTCALWMDVFLLGFLVFLSIEFFIAWRLCKGERMEQVTGPLLLSHLPWVLGWWRPWFVGLSLPAPHDFTTRKVEILFGLMLILHLFLFSSWLLRKSRTKKAAVSKRVGFIAVFLFASITLWTASVCDLSGDEPHYLLMAYSLVHDRDLDLSNNYADKDYREFYHRGDLEPQALEHVVDGRRYSHHPLGPVLLVLPGFALAGRMGAALTMALLAALALYLTLRVLEETGAGGWALHAVGVIGLFSSPFLLFAGVIYPEIPTACLVASGLLLFLEKRWLGLGLCQGALLWMHNRNVLLFIPLVLFSAYEIAKNPERGRGAAGKFALGLGLPLLALVLYFHSVYGVWTPLGAHNEPFTSLFRWSHFGAGFFGLALDQECGLWFHFPIFAMSVTGGMMLARSKKPLRFVILGTVLFYYLFLSFYENLGLTPATRYMVGIVPLLLPALYPVLEKMGKRDIWAFLTASAFGAGTLVNGLLAAVPWMRYNKLNGENWMLKIAGSFLHLPLTSWEPAFNPATVDPKSYVLSALWMGITVFLSVLFLKYEKKPH